MCDCFDVSDFVCFLTFFITTIVAVLFVRYFFVYLDPDLDDKTKMFYFYRCFYFLLLTFLGCLVFAGVQRRSVCLLKWPSRFLITLLSVGLISLTIFLWALDRIHKQSVRDLEAKSVKLAIAVLLLLIYFFGVEKLMSQIQSPRLSNGVTNSSININANYIFDQSDHSNHPNLVDIFRSKYLKAGSGSLPNDNDSEVAERQINVASNGVNYYKLLLEGSHSQMSRKWSIPNLSSGSIASASISEV